MIATAFVETDIDKILDAGAGGRRSEESKSRTSSPKSANSAAKIPTTGKPRAARSKTAGRSKAASSASATATSSTPPATIAALLYGRKDFVETLRIAFNFGWDADNNAATAATIVGVIRGRRWMNEQGWDIKDVYRNTTRDDMPNDETLTGLEDKLIAAARITIEKNGGRLLAPGWRGQGEGASIYRIRTERPANVEQLATPADQLTAVTREFGPRLESDLAAPGVPRARAAYIAICLGKADELKAGNPAAWSAAVAELEGKYPQVVRNLFKSPEPRGDELRQRAKAAGLKAPPKT